MGNKIEMCVFNNIDILIYAYNGFETLYVGLQMLRKQGFDFPIHVTCTYPNFGAADIAKIESQGAVFHHIGDNENDIVGSSISKHRGIIDSFKYYFNNTRSKKYVLFTFQDHWILRLDKLVTYLNYMINNNYDGFNFMTGIENDEVLSTTFFVLRANFIPVLMFSPAFRGEYVVFEKRFHEHYREVNWYLPNFNKNLIHAYGYKGNFGFGHFHNVNEKKHFIDLWEKHYRCKLDFDENKLQGENAANYDSGLWPFNVLPLDLDGDNSVINPESDEAVIPGVSKLLLRKYVGRRDGGG